MDWDPVVEYLPSGDYTVYNVVKTAGGQNIDAENIFVRSNSATANFNAITADTKFIVAQYDADGKVIKVNLKASGGTSSITVNFTKAANAAEIKCFIWDDAQRPYIEPAAISQE